MAGFKMDKIEMQNEIKELSEKVDKLYEKSGIQGMVSVSDLFDALEKIEIKYHDAFQDFLTGQSEVKIVFAHRDEYCSRRRLIYEIWTSKNFEEASESMDVLNHWWAQQPVSWRDLVLITLNFRQAENQNEKRRF